MAFKNIETVADLAAIVSRAATVALSVVIATDAAVVVRTRALDSVAVTDFVTLSAEAAIVMVREVRCPIANCIGSLKVRMKGARLAIIVLRMLKLAAVAAIVRVTVRRIVLVMTSEA